jgi:DNA-binding CsgD family transcriptional regulator
VSYGEYNPWGLTRSECLTMCAFVSRFTLADTALNMERTISTVEAHLASARTKMGAVSTAHAAVLFDRYLSKRAAVQGVVIPKPKAVAPRKPKAEPVPRPVKVKPMVPKRVMVERPIPSRTGLDAWLSA